MRTAGSPVPVVLSVTRPVIDPRSCCAAPICPAPASKIAAVASEYNRLFRVFITGVLVPKVHVVRLQSGLTGVPTGGEPFARRRRRMAQPSVGIHVRNDRNRDRSSDGGLPAATPTSRSGSDGGTTVVVSEPDLRHKPHSYDREREVVCKQRANVPQVEAGRKDSSVPYWNVWRGAVS